MSDPGTRRRVGNLPSEVTSFVNRRNELAEIRRRLTANRLLTLTGAGGVGKTRLALRAATEMQRQFADGVWLVDLAGLKDPRLLPQAVVGITDRGGSVQEPIALLSDYLVDKHLLILLDNCEHLVESCAALTHALLRAAPRLWVLATSRQALGIDGESTMVVRPLSVTAPQRDGGEGLAGCHAVTLFVDRACAVVPDFAITPANADAVATLCQRLDGIPLAIELAAVRLRHLSVKQLVGRLDNVFGLLTTGRRTSMPHQQTLRALIDWSYDLCLEPERVLWARLSVFAGSFDLDAGEYVGAGSGLDHADILDLITGLVDKSVLFTEQHAGRTRYRMLETIRQYGLEQLDDAGERSRVRGRHRDYFRGLGRQALVEWPVLDVEQANVRAALDFCCTEPGNAEAGLHIAANLHYYWPVSSLLHEGRQWLGRLFQLPAEPSVTRVRALCTYTYLALLSADRPIDTERLTQARELAMELGDPAGLASVAQVTGLAALFGGDPAGAVAHVREALERHAALGERDAWFDRIVLALTLSLTGDIEHAVTLCEECLASQEIQHGCWFHAQVLWLTGIVMLHAGDPKRAMGMERESIRVRFPFNDRRGIPLCIEVLAWAMAAQGMHRQAAELLGAASVLLAQAGASVRAYLYLYPDHERAVAMLRADLGDEQYDKAFRRGQRLDTEQAVALALEEVLQPSAVGLELVSPVSLSGREQEVADLIAKGLSNKDIAAELVIAQRTAEGHVQRILTKLGFNSRAQIAAWAVEYLKETGQPG